MARRRPVSWGVSLGRSSGLPTPRLPPWLAGSYPPHWARAPHFTAALRHGEAGCTDLSRQPRDRETEAPRRGALSRPFTRPERLDCMLLSGGRGFCQRARPGALAAVVPGTRGFHSLPGCRSLPLPQDPERPPPRPPGQEPRYTVAPCGQPGVRSCGITGEPPLAGSPCATSASGRKGPRRGSSEHLSGGRCARRRPTPALTPGSHLGFTAPATGGAALDGSQVRCPRGCCYK